MEVHVIVSMFFLENDKLPDITISLRPRAPCTSRVSQGIIEGLLDSLSNPGLLELKYLDIKLWHCKSCSN